MTNDQPSRQSTKQTTPQPSKQPHPVFDWRPILFTLLLFSFYYSLSGEVSKQQDLPYSEFKQALSQEKVSMVEITGYLVQGRYQDSTNNKGFDFKTRIPAIGDQELLPILEQHRVETKVKSEESPLWVRIVVSVLPWVLIFGFFAYSNYALQKRMGGGGGGGLFGFSRSRAKLYENLQQKTGFDDVAGLDSAKQELREVIEFLKNPEKFRRLGATLPKGILMMGPPGTGKTLLAKATAAEAGVPFFSISGSEFVEMFVGVGAGRVRDMFQQARDRAPALIFVDEIDSVGRVRGSGVGGGNDEREQTLNQILAEMDGFSSDDPIVVLAATNRPDVLDPALLRPGRFDRKITLELPQKNAREQILRVHVRNKPTRDDIDLEQLAARTIGFSGADLENLVNEAALHAAQSDKHLIDQEDFEYAHDKILLGTERQGVLNDEDKQRVAYHEAGHAIASWYLPNTDPLSKITIIPRGRSLGVTEIMPTEDRINYTQDFLENNISMLLGGRCSEQLVLGSVSSGAADDLKRATDLARKMVGQWGMNHGLGPVYFNLGEDHPFLGMEITSTKKYSDATGRLIDQEIEELIKSCENVTRTLLQTHRNELDKLAQALISQETLSFKEVEQILKP